MAKKNKKQPGKNIWLFYSELEADGLVQIERKLASRRFNWDLFCFANAVFPSGDARTTSMEEVTEYDGVFPINEADVDVYCEYFCPQVLRFDPLI